MGLWDRSEVMCFMQSAYNSGAAKRLGEVQWRLLSPMCRLPQGTCPELPECSRHLPNCFAPDFTFRSFAYCVSAWDRIYLHSLMSWCVSLPRWDTFKGDMSYLDASASMSGGRSLRHWCRPVGKALGGLWAGAMIAQPSSDIKWHQVTGGGSSLTVAGLCSGNLVQSTVTNPGGGGWGGGRNIQSCAAGFSWEYFMFPVALTLRLV